MKRIILCILALAFALGGCGMISGKGCDIPAVDVTYTEKSEGGLSISVENNTKFSLVCEGYKLQRKESDRWVLVKPKSENIPAETQFVCGANKTEKLKIDFETFYGELPPGWYCIVLDGFLDGASYPDWYNRVEFILN